MDIQHRMLRSTIEVLINKTVLDIQRDTHRSIRNFIDLGVSFAKGKNQKRFFDRMYSTIQDVNNPFYKLVSDVLTNLDVDTIKTVGTNLGCTSFTYGVNLIRKSEPALGVHIPPLIYFAWQDGDEASLPILKRDSELIAQAMEIGIYTYVFQANGDMSRVRDVFSLAEEYKICTFFLAIDPKIVSDELIELSERARNVIIGVEASPVKELNLDAMRFLHDKRCMFGCYIEYTDDSLERAISDEFVDSLISAGCYFGAYLYVKKGVPVPQTMIDFVRKMRSSAGKKILMFDCLYDLSYISRVISEGGDILRIKADGTATAGLLQEPDDRSVNVAGMDLNGILKEIMKPLK